jgi:probable F420-dependent oxidoreductase
MHSRWGLTIPLTGMPLPEHAALAEVAAASGYTDLWSAEVNGTDAFTPLALASCWSPSMRLGSAIAPVFTRGPALLAMTAAALAEAAPGRVAVGIGASSPAIVAEWNGLEFTDPYARTRDTLRFLRRALAGEVIDEAYPTFTVRRFRLDRPPPQPPRLMVAALRAGMLRLAAAEADGVILNWLADTDLPTVLSAFTRPDGGPGSGPDSGSDFEVVARIFVCPTDDAGYARTVGRRLISTYLTVGAYAEFHRWLGRTEILRPMWEAWAAGDRKGASAAVPDEVVDALVLHGTPAQIRKRVSAYVAGGVDVPVLLLLPVPGTDPVAIVRALGPAAEAGGVDSWN